ncbi:hypothetical protein J6590_030232, partial [Homalodisca vitripennis]
MTVPSLSSLSDLDLDTTAGGDVGARIHVEQCARGAGCRPISLVERPDQVYQPIHLCPYLSSRSDTSFSHLSRLLSQESS